MNLSIFIKGGIVMVPLSIMAIIALAIIIDKIFFLKKNCQLSAKILANIENPNIDFVKFIEDSKNLSLDNCYYNFFKILANFRDYSIEHIESMLVFEAKKFEKNFNKNLWILETIITSAPLLGLLGTIFGMSSSFKIIGENNLGNASGITAGVAESLIATAFGLIVALIALFAFNYFSKIQNQILDDMEIYGTKILETLKNSNENSKK